MEKEYLTANEICEKLKISYTTLYRLVKKGLPYLKVGNQQRFVFEEVEQWLKERK